MHTPTSHTPPPTPHRANKHDLLRGGRSDSGSSSLWSTGVGMYRDGGSGGSGGDGNAAVNASIRPGGGDGTGGGDECADGVVHLARRSPAEGGDSEVSGDGDGVGMARSLFNPLLSRRDNGSLKPDSYLAPVK
ncbi:hypothetical protein Tco_0373173 [Tanacetum coccineum]